MVDTGRLGGHGQLDWHFGERLPLRELKTLKTLNFNSLDRFTFRGLKAKATIMGSQRDPRWVEEPRLLVFRLETLADGRNHVVVRMILDRYSQGRLCEPTLG